MKNFKWILSGLCVALLVISKPALAWKLSPEGSFIEKELSGRDKISQTVLSTVSGLGVYIFGDSVHEEIVNRSLGCDGDSNVCGSPSFDPDNAYYLAGVRWNDDPPFKFGEGSGDFPTCKAGQTVRFVTQPVCWGWTFIGGKSQAKKGKQLDGTNANLMVRSHFGDFQFLHAMASMEKEPATTTQAKIMAWAEFTWRLGREEYDLESKVVSLPISGFDKLFDRNRGWRIQDLFAQGNPHVRNKATLSRVAFGSLLHVVQDSFAAGHVERRSPVAEKTCDKLAKPQPGKILEFHSYGKQKSSRHADSDVRHAFSTHWGSDRPGVVDVGRELVALYRARSEWTEVKPYLECIFALDEDARPASAGVGYED